MTCPICRQDHDPALTPLEDEIERLRADNAAMFKNLDEQTTTALLATSKWKQAEAEVERLRAERDEARATKDMHKERQEEEIGLRLQAEERLAKVVEALGAVHCPFCDEVFMVTVPKDAAAQPEEKRLEHDYVPCEGECRNKGCHHVQDGNVCSEPPEKHR